MSKKAEEYSKEFDSMHEDHTPDLPTSKAEQAALERFPVEMTRIPYQDLIDQFGGKTEIDVNTYPRCLFQQGYEQAWKNIKEWIEEQATILDEQTLLHPDDDVFWAQRNLFKVMKDKINSL